MLVSTFQQQFSGAFTGKPLQIYLQMLPPRTQPLSDLLAQICKLLHGIIVNPIHNPSSHCHICGHVSHHSVRVSSVNCSHCIVFEMFAVQNVLQQVSTTLTSQPACFHHLSYDGSFDCPCWDGNPALRDTNGSVRQRQHVAGKLTHDISSLGWV